MTAGGRSRLGSIAFRLIEQLLDPAQSDRYREANAALLAERDARPRIVFMGDSLFEGWSGLEALGPPELRLVDRGVSGQTSAQVLLRFVDDALSLRPAGVVVLVGANDVRAFFGPPAAIAAAACARVARNVTAMTHIASACGARLALGTVPPVRPGLARRAAAARRSPLAIGRVNAWLRAHAEAARLPLVDFHGALVDGEGALDSRFTGDGVHPNALGQARMAAVLAPILDDWRWSAGEALRRASPPGR